MWRWPGLASEFFVGKALAANLRHDQRESVGVIERVVLSSAIVISKYLFGDIAIKMKRLNSNVGSAKATLQQRPEVFDALRVHFSPNVLFKVVDGLMDVLFRCKVVIARITVRIDSRTAFDLVE